MSKRVHWLPQYFLIMLLVGLCMESRVFAATFFLPPPGTDVIGQIRVVIARRQDTLLDIARRYDLGYKEIIEANPDVDPWLPGEGTPVILPTQFILPEAPRRGIVLNLPAMRLYYYPAPKAGERPITHPIGIGRINWETHVGVTGVVAKVVNPVWYIPSSIREEHAMEGESLPKFVPAGPDNPLGQYAMRLGIPGYLIHGTNKPYGIGMRVSHGCIHLYPEDIAVLFRQVPVGTEVNIVNQPYLAGWLDGNLYLEAHRPLEEDRKKWANSLTPVVRTIIERSGHAHIPVDWNKALRITTQARSLPIVVSSSGQPHADR
jgi:L,D-transpeptidase ErfK/SrfK